jgi:hypothetical protein
MSKSTMAVSFLQRKIARKGWGCEGRATRPLFKVLNLVAVRRPEPVSVEDTIILMGLHFESTDEFLAGIPLSSGRATAKHELRESGVHHVAHSFCDPRKQPKAQITLRGFKRPTPFHL